MPCLVERSIANPASQDGTDKEQRDLIAQESAALWGFWIVVIGLIQLGLSALGLFALLRTLRQGQEGLDHSRKVADLQLRPYVYFGDPVLTLPLDLRSQVKLPYKNHGLSPAINVRMGTQSAIVSRPILDQARDLEISNWDESSPIGPQAESTLCVYMADMPPQSIEAVIKGDEAIVTIHVITYEGTDGTKDSDTAWTYIDCQTAISGQVMSVNEWARASSHKIPQPEAWLHLEGSDPNQTTKAE